MSGKRIVFTGGTGKAGRHAVPHLVAHGYCVLNVDLKPLDLPGVGKERVSHFWEARRRPSD